MILRTSTEKGASAVLVALCLILLIGMAALAFDVGLGMNERRQDQSAADVGSLAAAQFAKPVATATCGAYSGVQLARCNGAVEAIAVANATLDDPALANWTSAAECVAPPAGYVVAPNTPCVAFNNNLQRAWVHVPTIEVGTVFGRVIGFAAINTSADAIAITSSANGGNILPFLTPGISGSGDYDCLKTQGNLLDWGSCSNLPSTGNFGSADYFIYGNELLGSVTRCNGDTNGRLVYNIANGVDHPLGIHPTGTGAGIGETASCPIFSAEPDVIDEQTGVGSNLDIGLTQGDSANAIAPYDGRIEDAGGYTVRNPGGGNPATIVDDTPLWTYLASGLTGACASVSTPTEMLACINQAKAANTVIFTTAIANSPRFGFTALMWEPDFVGPGGVYHIQSFLPVFLDATFYGCNASTCDIVHTLGVTDSGPCPAAPELITCGTPGTQNKTLQAVTSYILDPDILPEGVKTPYPGAPNQRSFALAR